MFTQCSATPVNFLVNDRVGVMFQASRSRIGTLSPAAAAGARTGRTISASACAESGEHGGILHREGRDDALGRSRIRSAGADIVLPLVVGRHVGAERGGFDAAAGREPEHGARSAAPGRWCRRRAPRPGCRGGRARACRRAGRPSAAFRAASRSSRNRAPCRARSARPGRGRARRPRRRPRRRGCRRRPRARRRRRSPSRLSGAMPRSIGSPPRRPHQRRKPDAVRGDDLVRAGRPRRAARARRRWRGSRRAAAGGRAKRAWPIAAASEMARASSSRPARSSTSPSRKSRPAGRTKRPAATGSSTRIVSPVALGILLDEDGVGAVRHRRAGEDAHASPGPSEPAKRSPARDMPTTLSVRPGRRLGGADGIAVHGGGGEGRLRPPRRESAPSTRPAASDKRHGLGGERGRRRRAAAAAPRRRGGALISFAGRRTSRPSGRRSSPRA